MAVQVFVTTTRGKACLLELHGEDTIDTVKDRIELQWPAHPKHSQRILHNNAEVSNEVHLSSLTDVSQDQPSLLLVLEDINEIIDPSPTTSYASPTHRTYTPSPPVVPPPLSDPSSPLSPSYFSAPSPSSHHPDPYLQGLQYLTTTPGPQTTMPSSPSPPRYHAPPGARGDIAAAVSGLDDVNRDLMARLCTATSPPVSPRHSVSPRPMPPSAYLNNGVAAAAHAQVEALNNLTRKLEIGCASPPQNDPNAKSNLERDLIESLKVANIGLNSPLLPTYTMSPTTSPSPYGNTHQPLLTTFPPPPAVGPSPSPLVHSSSPSPPPQYHSPPMHLVTSAPTSPDHGVTPAVSRDVALAMAGLAPDGRGGYVPITTTTPSAVQPVPGSAPKEKSLQQLRLQRDSVTGAVRISLGSRAQHPGMVHGYHVGQRVEAMTVLHVKEPDGRVVPVVRPGGQGSVLGDATTGDPRRLCVLFDDHVGQALNVLPAEITEGGFDEKAANVEAQLARILWEGRDPIAGPKRRADMAPVPSSSEESGKKKTNTPIDPYYRARLLRFFERYNPHRLPSVATLLREYSGREEAMMQALVKKYGPEPPDPGEVVLPAGWSQVQSSYGDVFYRHVNGMRQWTRPV